MKALTKKTHLNQIKMNAYNPEKENSLTTSLNLFFYKD